MTESERINELAASLGCALDAIRILARRPEYTPGEDIDDKIKESLALAKRAIVPVEEKTNHARHNHP